VIGFEPGVSVTPRLRDGLLLDRYDVAAGTKKFAAAGVLEAIEAKGFANPRLSIDSYGSPLTHVRLHADKHGDSHLLFDGCLTEAAAGPEYFAARGYRIARATRLLVVFWAREQNPTARFSMARPRLPLQNHPGLGLLRKVFRVAAELATEMEKDGLAAYPKFAHDAILFYRSRLFLFLDGAEQGRLEALWRDLGSLGLRNFSLALSAGCIRDAEGRAVCWQPGLQIHPLADVLRDHFHSDAYGGAVQAAYATCRYRCDERGLAEAIAVFERSAPDVRTDSGAGG